MVIEIEISVSYQSVGCSTLRWKSTTRAGSNCRPWRPEAASSRNNTGDCISISSATVTGYKILGNEVRYAGNFVIGKISRDVVWLIRFGLCYLGGNG